ncbi:hypothetical protein ACHAWO_003789 [Cyclotella atomus]|uniref:Uncharacterized protein n=1 Tax=Cyclotella atomus TaxID=382360 RepID=A0ABD3NUC8_9STRA
MISSDDESKCCASFVTAGVLGSAESGKRSSCWAKLVNPTKASSAPPLNYPLAASQRGLRNGKGVAKWANGATYEGDYRDGYTEWQRGEWKDGLLRNGKGMFKWANGDEYDGDWKHDVQNGKGVYKQANVNMCGGEWKDGLLRNG